MKNNIHSVKRGKLIMNRVNIFFVILLLSFATIVSAGIIHVPGDQPTIQAGIDAAMDGDTVLVADGTYTGLGNKDLDFWGKAITVKSENGPENCIIDCEGSEADLHRGFYFHSGEIEDSVVQGFTIQNGYITSSAAAPYYGGGIYCRYSSPTITSNTITNNEAGRYGGGIFCWSSSPKITNNTISGNTANTLGGGISCYNSSSPTITKNTIFGNMVTDDGGGISCHHNSSPTIANNTIFGNTATSGGGIRCYYYSSPTITDNVITRNTVTHHGGGIYQEYSSPTIFNNTILGNMAGVRGGGIYCSNSSPAITNNTIFGNTANTRGGGIYCRIGSFLTITNTILWDNKAAIGKEIYLGNTADPSTLTISYSDVQGGQDAVHVTSGSTLNWDSGMIDADPLFVTGPWGNYYLSHIACGQSEDSPCIDGSDPASSMIEWTTRIDSVKDSGIVDMGYHYPMHCMFNPSVNPPVGTEETPFTYSVHVRTPDEAAPGRIYLVIDGEYADEMILSYGSVGNGIYNYSTYLEGLCHHDVVFYCDLIPQPKIASLSSSIYSLPPSGEKAYHFPLVVQLMEIPGDEPQIEVGN